MTSSFNIDSIYLTVLAIFLFIHQKIFNKSESTTAPIGLALIIVASFFDNREFIVPLCIIAESAFILNEGKYKKLYFNFILWIPILFSLVFRENGTQDTFLVFLTIALKNISWPFYMDEEVASETTSFIQKFLVPIILWRTVQLQDPTVWSLVWLCLVPIFSFRMNAKEVLVFYCLSLFTLGQDFASIAITLGLLYFIESVWTVSLVALLSLVSSIIWNQNTPITYELKIIALVFIVLSTSRVLVAKLKSISEKVKYDQITILSALFLSLVSCFLVNPLLLEKFTLGDGVIASLTLIFSTTLGYFIHSKYPQVFESTKNFFILKYLKNKIKEKNNSPELEFEETRFVQFNLGQNYIDIMDRETHTYILISIVALFLIWSHW